MPSAKSSPLLDRIRALGLKKGWDLSTLAARAGLSRTTVYYLGQQRTRFPHAPTLAKLAQALDVQVSLLWPASPAPGSRTAFERHRHPAIAGVHATQPELFHGWQESDWAELERGAGANAAATAEQVTTAAQAINRRRETLFQLDVVLGTDLRPVAEQLVTALFHMVTQPASETDRAAQVAAVSAALRSD